MDTLYKYDIKGFISYIELDIDITQRYFKLYNNKHFDGSKDSSDDLEKGKYGKMMEEQLNMEKDVYYE
jgi:hypothetical protein